jgi:hypothetical protein
VRMIRDAIAGHDAGSSLTEAGAQLLFATMHRYAAQEIAKRRPIASIMQALRDWRWASHIVGGLYARGIFLGERILAWLRVLEDLPAMGPADEVAVVVEALTALSKCFLVHEGYLHQPGVARDYARFWDLIDKLPKMSMSGQQDMLRLISQMARIIPFNGEFMREAIKSVKYICPALDSLQVDFVGSGDVFASLLRLSEQAWLEERVDGLSFPFADVWASAIHYATTVRNPACIFEIVDVFLWILRHVSVSLRSDSKLAFRAIFDRELAKPRLPIPSGINRDEETFEPFWNFIEVASLCRVSGSGESLWSLAKGSLYHAAMLRHQQLPPGQELMTHLNGVSDSILWVWLDTISFLEDHRLMDLLSDTRFAVIGLCMQALVTKNWPSSARLLQRAIPMVHFARIDAFLPQNFRAFASVHTDVDALAICDLLRTFHQSQLALGFDHTMAINAWLHRMLSAHTDNPRLAQNWVPSVNYFLSLLDTGENGFAVPDGTVLHDFLHMQSFQAIQSCPRLDNILRGLLAYPPQVSPSARIKWAVRFYKALQAGNASITSPLNLGSELHNQADLDFGARLGSISDLTPVKVLLLRLAQQAAESPETDPPLRQDAFMFIVQELRQLLDHQHVHLLLPDAIEWLSEPQVDDLVPERLHFVLNDRILSSLPMSLNTAAKALVIVLNKRKGAVSETMQLMCSYLLKKVHSLDTAVAKELVEALLVAGTGREDVEAAVSLYSNRLSLSKLSKIATESALIPRMLIDVELRQFLKIQRPLITDWSLHSKRLFSELAGRLLLSTTDLREWLSSPPTIQSPPARKRRRSTLTIQELLKHPSSISSLPFHHAKTLVLSLLTHAKSPIHAEALKTILADSTLWQPLMSVYAAYYYADINEWSWVVDWARCRQALLKQSQWSTVAHVLCLCAHIMDRHHLEIAFPLISSVSPRHFETKELRGKLSDKAMLAAMPTFPSLEAAMITEAAFHLAFSKGELSCLERWISARECSILASFPDDVVARLVHWRCVAGSMVMAARQYSLTNLPPLMPLAEAFVEHHFAQESPKLLDIPVAWTSAQLHSKFAVEGLCALAGVQLDAKDPRCSQGDFDVIDDKSQEHDSRDDYSAEVDYLAKDKETTFLPKGGEYEQSRALVLRGHQPCLFGAHVEEKERVFTDVPEFLRNPSLDTAQSAPLPLLRQLATFKEQFGWLQPVVTLLTFARMQRNADPEGVYQLLLSNAQLLMADGRQPTILVDTLLKLASHASRHRCALPSAIQRDYLQVAYDAACNANNGSDLRWTAQHDLAVFLEERFVLLHASIPSKREQCVANQAALAALKAQIRSADVDRQRLLLDTQVILETEELQTMLAERKVSLVRCLEHYLQVLKGTDRYDLVVFKVVALWFEDVARDVDHVALGDVLLVLERSLPTIPSHKFVPLLVQLCSQLETLRHLSSNAPSMGVKENQNQSFSNPINTTTTSSGTNGTIMSGHLKVLTTLVLRIASKHPYHAAWTLICQARPSAKRTGKEALSPVVKILETLKGGNPNNTGHSANYYYCKVFQAVQLVSDLYLELALQETTSDQAARAASREIAFEPAMQAKLHRYNEALNLCPVPTRTLQVEPDGQYRAVVTLSSWGTGFTVIGGINLPKIIVTSGSDGLAYKQLVKGRDDVRQDAMVEQLFATVNRVLSGAKSGGGVRTFRVVPLAANAGVLEWVPESVPLGDYLNGAHERWRPQDRTPRDVRRLMKADFEDPKTASRGLEHKLRLFEDICRHFQPVLRYFFFEHMPRSADWQTAKAEFTKSVASTSLLGYVVGLGDRHCQNILLDTKRGSVVHIDLNMIFEGGRALRVPERVPFRLTRDIQDGLLSLRAFQGHAVAILRALRQEERILLTVLGSCLSTSSHPHLTSSSSPPSSSSSSSFDLSPTLLRARERLRGLAGGSTASLSVEAHVRLLVEEATSPENLAVMYPGWQPWM